MLQVSDRLAVSGTACYITLPQLLHWGNGFVADSPLLVLNQSVISQSVRHAITH